MGERTRSIADEPEDDRGDLRGLVRTALWGLAAAAAVTIAILAARSEAGDRRIHAVLDGLPVMLRPGPTAIAIAPAPVVHSPPAEAESRRLAEAVRGLATDRDRLLARLEALERNLDVTGALPARSDAAAQVEAPSKAAPAPAAAEPSASAPPPAAVSAASLADWSAADSIVTRTEFGIDLGGDGTLDGLRGLWVTVRAQHGALLEGLRPVIAVRETGAAGGVELRLVAGPLTNAAAAARLCAVLAATRGACRTASFEGQRLALR